MDFSDIAIRLTAPNRAVIKFLIIAFCIFLVAKEFSAWKRKEVEQEEAKSDEPSEEVRLLRKIAGNTKK